jgi:hypothetical protein
MKINLFGYQFKMERVTTSSEVGSSKQPISIIKTVNDEIDSEIVAGHLTELESSSLETVEEREYYYEKLEEMKRVNL